MTDDSTNAVVEEPAVVETETETLVTARRTSVAEGNGFEKRIKAEERKTQGPPKSIWREIVFGKGQNDGKRASIWPLRRATSQCATEMGPPVSQLRDLMKLSEGGRDDR